ncbi:MAG TPA: glycosyltransferase [Chitinivibrionales bacterium]
MKIAWIFPQNKRCGISMYSHAFVQALEPHAEILCIDPEEICKKPQTIGKITGQCRLAHIQYETAFFMKNGIDHYRELCSLFLCPIVVTLHEVYRQFPGVYPRQSIAGSFPIGLVKRWLYDWKHPCVTALTRHTTAHFYARRILVHWMFQKEILESKGVSGELVGMIPFPVKSVEGHTGTVWDNASPLRMTATGFVSDSYDFDLLLKTLDLCTVPWKFTWIGGLRRPEDRSVLKRLEEAIRRRNWTDRFTITGWVDDEARGALLREAHIYVALFKHKSSSESLATALGAQKLIVAAAIELTREITAASPCMLLTQPSARECAEAIERIAQDAPLRGRMHEAVQAYTERFSHARCTRQLLEEYERMLHA